MNCYTVIESPIGYVGIATNASGVCRVEFCQNKQQPGRILHDFERNDAALAQPAEAIRRYLHGQAASLEDIVVDLAAGTEFQQAVWQTLRAIGPGQTISYGELAARAGKPLAARAVGNAMNRNPVPLLVPCHRVIHANGTIGGFGSGLKIKRYLLQLEGIRLPENS